MLLAAGIGFGVAAARGESLALLVAAAVLLLAGTVAAAMAVRRWTTRRLFHGLTIAVALVVAAGVLVPATGAVLRCHNLSPGADLASCDLGSAQLAGTDLSGADLGGADLGSADLSNADLTEATLTSAVLTGADLSGADLTGAVLESAELEGSDLTDARLDGISATGLRAEGVDLAGVSLREAELGGATLAGAVLEDADLTAADLGGAGLRLVDAAGATLTGASMTQAELTDADLTAADLTEATLDSAVLAGADLPGADLTDAGLPGADLAAATLDEAVLTNADLTAASLTRASLDGADLTDADLTDADLTFATVTGAALDRADLTSARLAQADLEGASLEGTTLSGTGFEDTAGLTDAMLRDAFGIPDAQLPAAVTGAGLRFEDPASVEAAVSEAVRAGERLPEARAYTRSPAFHPVVLVEGGRFDSAPWFDSAAGTWGAPALRFTELAMTVTSGRELIETRAYGYASGAFAHNIERYRQTAEVTLRSVRTGEVVAVRTFYGSMPRALNLQEPESLYEVEGGEVAYSAEVLPWVEGLVHPLGGADGTADGQTAAYGDGPSPAVVSPAADVPPSEW